MKSLFRLNSGSGASAETPARGLASALAQPKAPAHIKVALLGDAGVGKTSLMARYAEEVFDPTQLPTQGINFMERSVALGSQEVVFSIWDIGGHADSESMLPLVCNDAVAILLLFDLTRPETLDAVRDWHRRARALNKCALPVLVGCKYDLLLSEAEPEAHAHIGRAARRFASAIGAPLVFCAPSVPIHVAAVFKVVLIRLFGLAHAVPQLRQPGEPLLIYEPELLLDSDQGANGAATGPLPSQPPPPPPHPSQSSQVALPTRVSQPPPQPPSSRPSGVSASLPRESGGSCGSLTNSSAVFGV